MIIPIDNQTAGSLDQPSPVRRLGVVKERATPASISPTQEARLLREKRKQYGRYVREKLSRSEEKRRQTKYTEAKHTMHQAPQIDRLPDPIKHETHQSINRVPPSSIKHRGHQNGELTSRLPDSIVAAPSLRPESGHAWEVDSLQTPVVGNSGTAVPNSASKQGLHQPSESNEVIEDITQLSSPAVSEQQSFNTSTVGSLDSLPSSWGLNASKKLRKLMKHQRMASMLATGTSFDRQAQQLHAASKDPFCKANLVHLFGPATNQKCSRKRADDHIPNSVWDTVHHHLVDKLVSYEAVGDPFSIINIYMEEEGLKRRPKKASNMPHVAVGSQKAHEAVLEEASVEAQERAWENRSDLGGMPAAGPGSPGRPTSSASDRENVSLNITGKLTVGAGQAGLLRSQQPQLSETSTPKECKDVAGGQHAPQLAHAFQAELQRLVELQEAELDLAALEQSQVVGAAQREMNSLQAALEVALNRRLQLECGPAGSGPGIPVCPADPGPEVPVHLAEPSTVQHPQQGHVPGRQGQQHLAASGHNSLVAGGLPHGPEVAAGAPPLAVTTPGDDPMSSASAAQPLQQAQLHLMTAMQLTQQQQLAQLLHLTRMQEQHKQELTQMQQMRSGQGQGAPMQPFETLPLPAHSSMHHAADCGSPAVGRLHPQAVPTMQSGDGSIAATRQEAAVLPPPDPATAAPTVEQGVPSSQHPLQREGLLAGAAPLSDTTPGVAKQQYVERWLEESHTEDQHTEYSVDPDHILEEAPPTSLLAAKQVPAVALAEQDRCGDFPYQCSGLQDRDMAGQGVEESAAQMSEMASRQEVRQGEALRASPAAQHQHKASVVAAESAGVQGFMPLPSMPPSVPDEEQGEGMGGNGLQQNAASLSGDSGSPRSRCGLGVGDAEHAAAESTAQGDGIFVQEQSGRDCETRTALKDDAATRHENQWGKEGSLEPIIHLDKASGGSAAPHSCTSESEVTEGSSVAPVEVAGSASAAVPPAVRTESAGVPRTVVPHQPFVPDSQSVRVRSTSEGGTAPSPESAPQAALTAEASSGSEEYSLSFEELGDDAEYSYSEQQHASAQAQSDAVPRRQPGTAAPVQEQLQQPLQKYTIATVQGVSQPAQDVPGLQYVQDAVHAPVERPASPRQLNHLVSPPGSRCGSPTPPGQRPLSPHALDDKYPTPPASPGQPELQTASLIASTQGVHQDLAAPSCLPAGSRPSSPLGHTPRRALAAAPQCQQEQQHQQQEGETPPPVTPRPLYALQEDRRQPQSDPHLQPGPHSLLQSPNLEAWSTEEVPCLEPFQSDYQPPRSAVTESEQATGPWELPPSAGTSPSVAASPVGSAIVVGETYLTRPPTPLGEWQGGGGEHGLQQGGPAEEEQGLGLRTPGVQPAEGDEEQLGQPPASPGSPRVDDDTVVQSEAHCREYLRQVLVHFWTTRAPAYAAGEQPLDLEGFLELERSRPAVGDPQHIFNKLLYDATNEALAQYYNKTLTSFAGKVAPKRALLDRERVSQFVEGKVMGWTGMGCTAGDLSRMLVEDAAEEERGLAMLTSMVLEEVAEGGRGAPASPTADTH